MDRTVINRLFTVMVVGVSVSLVIAGIVWLSFSLLQGPLDASDQLASVVSAYVGILGLAVTAIGTAVTIRQSRQVRGNSNPSLARKAPIPRQLPAHTPMFAGRATELNKLNAILGDGQGPYSTGVVIVTGVAGAGKTTLAVHWAKSLAARFPDGQLYVNLRGFDSSDSPLSAAEAVHGFLQALGVPAEAVPVGVEAQTALYRSILTERRLLIVLDNVRSADQILSLLPANPNCLTVVTSRRRLGSLVALSGAKVVTLEPLSHDEAKALFATYLGRERVDAEAEVVASLIDRCAGLPLALVIVATRAAINPTFSLRCLLDELGQEQNCLDALSSGDQGSSVRAVISWSYRALTPDAATLFRLLAVHPGPDLDKYVAASLQNVSLPRSNELLADLAQANLIDEHEPGRYRLHDLLRAYARERTSDQDSELQRIDALRRAFEYYMKTSAAANELLYPHWSPTTSQALDLPVAVRAFSGYEDALRWFTVEHSAALRMIGLAVQLGLDSYAVGLSWTFDTFLHRRGHWQDWVTTLEVALSAARRLNDAGAEASTHHLIGRALTQLGRHADSAAHFERALRMCRGLGDRNGEAITLHALSWESESRGEYPDAVAYARAALEIFSQEGLHFGEARANNALGWALVHLDEHEEALEHCSQSLAIHRELDNRYGQAQALDSLGYVLHKMGRYAEAISRFEESLELRSYVGEYYYVADTLHHLGDTHFAAANHDAARDAFGQALAILDQFSHPDAEKVRTKLAELV